MIDLPPDLQKLDFKPLKPWRWKPWKRWKNATLQRSFKEPITTAICPKTGTPMHRDVRPLKLTYKGESITFDMPGWYCDQSDESIHTGKVLKLSDRMLNRVKARSEGLLEPEDIRRIRKKLRLTQEAAGLMIGGGPRAFQKYESGDLLPSRAINSADE